MMNKIFFLILVLATLSCKKAEDVPKCINKKIADWDESTNCEEGVKVEEYEFQDEIVYIFSPGNCGADLASPVYDTDCNDLGFLGGFGGNTTINGEEFSNATFIRTVWQK